MLSSCKRCLIVMPFSEQWLSIDWISSNVIICVLFNAKVARTNPGYKMHFFGGLRAMGYILHKGTTGRRGGEAYEAAGRGIKSTLLRAVGPGAEWYGVTLKGRD